MKEIICKSPKEYLNNVKVLEEKGLYASGNSYTCTLFCDKKTQEEKVLLKCAYVKSNN